MLVKGDRAGRTSDERVEADDGAATSDGRDDAPASDDRGDAGDLDIWRQSDEYRGLLGRSKEFNFRRSVALAALVAPVLVLASLLLLYVSSHLVADSQPTVWLGALALVLSFVAVVVTLAVFFIYTMAKRAFYDRVRAKKARQVDEAVERLRYEDQLHLPNLFALNRRQLDEYHVISVRQQNVAFRNAQVAGVLGFLALLGGVVVVLTQSGGTETWLAAGLSGLGAALSGYIATVFFKQADETSKQLQQFYREPSRTGLILTIERLAALDGVAGSGESDAREVRKLIVTSLLEHLHGEAGSANGGSKASGSHSSSAA